MTWSKFCEALAYIIQALVVLAKERKDAAVRERAANDGSGMLLKQLNPGTSDINKSATRDTGRSSGSVDE